MKKNDNKVMSWKDASTFSYGPSRSYLLRAVKPNLRKLSRYKLRDDFRVGCRR